MVSYQQQGNLVWLAHEIVILVISGCKIFNLREIMYSQ
jgi:hypothetical protein